MHTYNTIAYSMIFSFKIKLNFLLLLEYIRNYFSSFIYIPICISYLWLHLKLPQNLMAQNYKYLLSQFLWVRNLGGA